jgi:hypothetical protein
MTPAARHIRRETLVSVIINVALSLLFFLLVFGWQNPVSVWGVGELAFDFLPQSFMIALMGTLVPGALTAAKLRKGSLERLPGTTRLPGNLVLRALLLAALSMIAGTALTALLLRASGVEQMAWSSALAIKLVYGGLLALLVTPIGLAAALRSK